MAKGPTYYQRGSTDVWDFIREQGLNFHLGNAIKYICRAGYKDSTIKDLEKAIHYLENELQHVSNNNPRHTSHIPEHSSEGVQVDIRAKEFIDQTLPFLSEESDRRGI